MLGFFFFFLSVGSFFCFSYFWLMSCFFVVAVFLFFPFFFSYGWEDYYGFFFLDGTSCLMISLSFLITFLMYLASARVYNTNFFSGHLSFFFFFLCLSLVLSFSVHNFFLFFIFFEVSLIPTLLIILGWGYQPERLQAGYYMMLYTIFSSLPLLAVIFFWSLKCGSFFIFSFWDFTFVNFSSFFSFFLFFFSFFAFFVKLPVYGAHLWLPKAHVEAPVSGSMILAGVLLKLGGYGLFRVFSLYSFSFFPQFWGFLCVFLWGGVLSSMICLRQCDMKGLVAYSSVGHMAVLLCGYLSGSFLGSSGGLLMMVGHGLCSSCMFVLASLSYDLFGSRSLYFVKGMLSVCPSVSLWWFIFSVGNMAAPTSLNLCSELMLFIALLMKSFYLFFFLGILSFLVGAYSLYFFLSPNHGFLLEGASWFFSGSVLSFLLYFAHFFYLFLGFFLMDIFLM